MGSNGEALQNTTVPSANRWQKCALSTQHHGSQTTVGWEPKHLWPFQMGLTCPDVLGVATWLNTAAEVGTQ